MRGFQNGSFFKFNQAVPEILVLQKMGFFRQALEGSYIS